MDQDADTVRRMKLTLPTLTCKRCAHQWHPRKPEPPPRCAKCGSVYWNKPRRKPQKRG